MWLKQSKRYFCKIENFAYGEINERSFSNPHPCRKFMCNWRMECSLSDVYIIGITFVCSRGSQIWNLCYYNRRFIYTGAHINTQTIFLAIWVPILKIRSGLILGWRPANERQCYFVMMSFIGWVPAWNQPCKMAMSKKPRQTLDCFRYKIIHYKIKPVPALVAIPIIKIKQSLAII